MVEHSDKKLLFRGISKGIGNDETVTAENLVAALQAGVEAAYKAVMKPTEGTILTVSRETAEYAVKIASQTEDICEFANSVNPSDLFLLTTSS